MATPQRPAWVPALYRACLFSRKLAAAGGQRSKHRAALKCIGKPGPNSALGQPEPRNKEQKNQVVLAFVSMSVQMLLSGSVIVLYAVLDALSSSCSLQRRWAHGFAGLA